MDYFGTVYSQLSYLQSFPFDRITIDRSFIRTKSRTVWFAQSRPRGCGHGQGLGMETTAEGVDQQQANKFLLRLAPRCRAFCFIRPLPASE